MNFSQRSVTDRTIPCGWSERELQISGHTIRLVLPSRPDEIFDQLDKTEDTTQELDPYWAELWSACLPMARLVNEANWPSQTRAVELGCGIGVVGLAAMLAGINVTFTDRVELAVAMAVENAQRNGITEVEGFVLDWVDPPRLQYSLILASDVLYDRELHVYFLNAVRSLLEVGGECWIGDPGRSATDHFLESDALAGFDVKLSNANGNAAEGTKTGEFRLIRLKLLA